MENKNETQQNPVPANKEKSDLSKRKIGALWLRTSKNGNKYLSGTLEFEGKPVIHISVLKNGSKKLEKHPDYQIFLQSDEPSNDFV